MGVLNKKVFAVVLDKQNHDVEVRITKTWNAYKYTPTFYLIAVEQGTTTADVARVAGIKGTNRDASGIVFKLNAAYSGYTRKEVWEWLSDVEDV